jgi:thymidylate synthase (FAD)
LKIADAKVELMGEVDGYAILEAIERAGRLCYKSEDKIIQGSAERFVKMLLSRGHEAMIEHGGLICLKFTCDRGISHELARHRLFSFAQESTRYCNYAGGKFGKEITVIKPLFWDEGSKAYEVWKEACETAEKAYSILVNALGETPEKARSVLPNSLKTEMAVSGNPRQWRQCLKLRLDEHAHPQMREVMKLALEILKGKIPVLFDDIGVKQ